MIDKDALLEVIDDVIESCRPAYAVAGQAALHVLDDILDEMGVHSAVYDLRKGDTISKLYLRGLEFRDSDGCLGGQYIRFMPETGDNALVFVDTFNLPEVRTPLQRALCAALTRL